MINLKQLTKKQIALIGAGIIVLGGATTVFALSNNSNNSANVAIADSAKDSDKAETSTNNEATTDKESSTSDKKESSSSSSKDSNKSSTSSKDKTTSSSSSNKGSSSSNKGSSSSSSSGSSSSSSGSSSSSKPSGGSGSSSSSKPSSGSGSSSSSGSGSASKPSGGSGSSSSGSTSKPSTPATPKWWGEGKSEAQILKTAVDSLVWRNEITGETYYGLNNLKFGWNGENVAYGGLVLVSNPYNVEFWEDFVSGPDSGCTNTTVEYQFRYISGDIYYATDVYSVNIGVPSAMSYDEILSLYD